MSQLLWTRDRKANRHWLVEGERFIRIQGPNDTRTFGMVIGFLPTQGV
jgi:hypothetical protein